MSRLAKQDQRKVYLDWANHYLKKGGYSDTIVDLKEIADGQCLPKVIHAVVMEEVPDLCDISSGDDARRENIDRCIKFLQSCGVNCSTVSAKDLCDANMKTILSLFYNLSQFKKASSKTAAVPASPMSPPSPANAVVTQSPLANTAATPKETAPGLKEPAVLPKETAPGSKEPAVTPKETAPGSKEPAVLPKETAPGSKEPAVTPKEKDPEPENPHPSRICRPVSPGLRSTHGISSGQSTGTKSIPGIRKHAGSSIQTSTSFDPGRQRKIPQKPLGLSDSVAPSDEKVETTPTLLIPSANPASPLEVHTLNEAQPSTQAGMAMEAPPNSPALVPVSAPSKASPQIGRGPTSKEEVAPADKPQDLQSRLKFPGSVNNSSLAPVSGSGRSTPSLGRSGSLLLKNSGLSRPSSRLSKQGEQHKSLDDLDADDEDNGLEKMGVPIPLTRKGSDGAVKKHKVAGSASLPRQLSKVVPDYSMFSSPGNGALSSSESEVGLPAEQSQAHPNLDGPEGTPKVDTPSGTKRALKMPSKIASGLPVSSVTQPAPAENLTPAAEKSGKGGEEEEEDTRRMTVSLEETRSSSRLQMPKPGGPSRELRPLGERKIGMPRGGKDMRLMATMSIPTPTIQPCESFTGSNSSLDSCSGATESQVAESSKLDVCFTAENPLRNSAVQKKGLSVQSSFAASSTNDPTSPVLPNKDIATLGAGDNNRGGDLDKDIGSPVATPSPRCFRRISPEGMSHEEALSPSEVASIPSEKVQTFGEKELSILKEDHTSERKVVDMADAKKTITTTAASAAPDTKTVSEGSGVSVCAEGNPLPSSSQPANNTVTQKMADNGTGPSAVPTAVPIVTPSGNFHLLPGTAHIPRIDQLSSPGGAPKRARSLSPARPHRSDDFKEEPSILMAEVGEQRPLSTSSSGSIGGDSTKSDPPPVAVSKPLRSSLKSSSSMRRNAANGSDSSLEKVQHRVTISPRESQIEYMSDHPIITLGSTSQLIAGVHSPGAVRRTTVKRHDKDYLEGSLLGSKLQQQSTLEKLSEPTPQLLETYEAQLARMRKDLEDKARMLNMYENNMADLSSKMHNLKKTLEEKDAEIKLLTDERQRWDISLEARSLASRAASEAGGLSDGCLSDGGEGEEGGEKEVKKKKKPWKQRFSFRKKKDIQDVPASVEVESIISTQTISKGSKSKKKPLDLTSISELSPLEQKLPAFKDLDARSMLTLGPDITSECVPTTEQLVTVYEDHNPGTPAQVILQVGCSDEEAEQEDVILGSLNLSPALTWVVMDTKITEIFMHHINCIDPDGYLGLSEDSILHYYVSEQRRELGNALLPPQTPHQSLGTRASVRVVLKGAAQDACDSLAYRTLVNVLTLQAYMAMLNDTRWLVVMGTKGTCKTSIASGLAEHLALGLTGSHSSDAVVHFSPGKEGVDVVLHYMKNDLPKNSQHRLYPPIILLDEVYDCSVMEQVLGVASSLSKRPFIVSTLCSGTTRGIPLHQLLLHHQVRVISCNPQQEPVVGILSRSLRKRVFYLKAHSHTIDPAADRMLSWLPYLLEHLNSFINKFHSNNVALGPRVFMGCPVDQSGPDVEVWFINLWNHFIIPYLMGTIMAGIETYSADPCLDWIDVREWVVETYPWQPSVNVNRLKTLNPDDVGWNHAVRPQHSRMRYLNDPTRLEDDTRSLIRMS